MLCECFGWNTSYSGDSPSIRECHGVACQIRAAIETHREIGVGFWVDVYTWLTANNNLQLSSENSSETADFSPCGAWNRGYQQWVVQLLGPAVFGVAQPDVLDDFRKLPLLPGGLTVPVSVGPGLIKRIHLINRIH